MLWCSDIDDIICALQSKGQELRNIVEMRFDLPSFLLSHQVISLEEYTMITQYKTNYDRCDKLFGYLLQKSETICTTLLTGLSETGQTHVVNFIKTRPGGKAFVLQ